MNVYGTGLLLFSIAVQGLAADEQHHYEAAPVNADDVRPQLMESAPGLADNMYYINRQIRAPLR